MKKVRISLLVFIVALVCFVGIVASAADGAILKTTPFRTTQDETFKTTVYLEENSNLIDFQIQFKYNTEVVELVSVCENENMKGTMEITQKDDGLIHVSYTKTSANLVEKSEMFDLEFKVSDTVGPGKYEFLTMDSSYDTQAHTMVNNVLVDLPIIATFDKLNIYASGDVDLDGDVTIADVTYLRQHLASIRTLDDYQLQFADAFYDGEVSISDAVRIQQHLANESIILGNRVNITFYDKDGNIHVVKSVKYGEDLLNYPEPITYKGFTWIGWSATPGSYTEIISTNLKKDIAIYPLYDQDASEAVTFYKERLKQTYYTNDVINGSLTLCNDMVYQDGYTARINWSTSNNLIINATNGEFTKPIYDTKVVLTANIVSYYNGSIEAEDAISFTYTAIGEFQCPSKEEIREYLSTIVGTEIDTNLALPRKISNAEVQGEDGDDAKKYEVRINWAILGEDNVENGVSQIARSAYEENISLVANVTFNGTPIENDGKIYFDDITLKPITEKEVSDYIIDQIASNMGLSMTDNEFLWNNDTKYNATIRWISKNTRIATVENNQVTIKSTAINGEALPLVAEVTYPTDNGAVTFELSYTVNVVADNKLLVPGTNIDEALYDALKTATGVYGNLTTDALKDITFVYLDLSDYPEITDLSGLTYCSNLRVLNISGLRIEKGLNEIASLSKLEALIARDCGFEDSSLTDGGIPILKNMIYLQMLDLSYNNFTTLNSVFGEECRYGRLKELYLGHNQLEDISALKNAPLVQMLLLEDNNLESEDLENFQNFKVIKLLSLANNNIDSISNLKNNRSLLDLRLYGNNISDVRDLRNMTYLESLYLGENNVSNIYSGATECNVSYLNYLTNLKILYLNDNNIQDINDLTALTNLEAVNVSNNQIQSLAVLERCSGTMVELYAENNEIASFNFVNKLPKLKKLMLSGNASTYESTLPSVLANLTELETLTLSGKDLRTLSFVEKMPNLIRLDVANCNLTENDDVQRIAGLNNTLCFLDVSSNKFDDIAPLQQLSKLIVFYADNACQDVDADELFALMSEIKYVSMENAGITEIGWLSKFRNLVYVNFAGSNLFEFDLGTHISARSRNTLKYLYLDSRTPFTFKNSYTTFNDNILEELSMENVQMEAVDYIPDMPKLKYLNLSNSNIKDLRGSNPDMYGIFSIGRLESGEYRFEELEVVDVTGVQADISVLCELPNLKKVYNVGNSNEMAFYKTNLHALQDLYNSGIECYLYDYETQYKPVAADEGKQILGEIPDISCDVKVAGGNVFSDNNPTLLAQINGYDIEWSVSNTTNYAIVDNKLAVVDYTGIDNEALTLTARIKPYDDQETVERTFTINTNIVRVNADALDINADGIGDNLQRNAVFNYDVKIKKITVDGFTGAVLPVYDNAVYSYEATLENGNVALVENTVIENANHNYKIHPEAPLGAKLKIKVDIGHNKNSQFVVDHSIERIISIASRTFTVTYVPNGGSVVTNEGAVITSEVYVEDSVLFEKIKPTRAGYTFAGWYTDVALTTQFSKTTMPSSDLTLYAKWNVNKYKVTFDTAGGSAIVAQDVVYNTTATKPADPTRELYLFTGWYKDSACTVNWNFETDKITADTTIYAGWIYQEYTVYFNANSGSVSTTSKKVRYKEAYGTLPTPTKDYYTFNGWYTAASGGEKVTNATVLNVTNDVTIYAQWALNPVSGWVLKSDMPSDAQTVDIKYSYKQTYYKDSQETSMSGWNLYSSKWVKSGSGSFNYATFPSGFDTSHSIYKNFKQSAYSAYENTTSKREVSTSWAGYVYWHWMYDVSYANTTTRAIYNQKGYGPDNGFYYKCFYALTSSTDCPYLDKYYCNTLYLPSYNCHSILPSSKSGIGTPRFFRFDYRKCSYTDYYKLFTYTRSENLESASYPSGENISNIKEWVIYRSK